MHQQHPAATDGAERPLTASDATRQVHAEGDTVAAAVSDHASSSPVASESHIIDLTHAEPPPGPLNVALQYAMPADSDTQSAPFSAPAPSELVVATAAPPAVLPTVGVSIAAVPPPSSSLPPHLLLLHPQLHIKNHRVKKRPCHVPGCAQIIESDRERYDHMVKMHQIYLCVGCELELPTESEWRAHLPSHRGDRPLMCDFCGRGFHETRDLTRHVSTHAGERPHQCPDCHACFTRSGALAVHRRTHQEDPRPFRCEVDGCGKTFTQKQTLKTHMRVHTGEKPFRCTVCDRSYAQRSALVTHHRTHTGDKPFQCQFCAKTFINASNMIVHQRTHTGDAMHECDRCDKKFTRRAALIKHAAFHDAAIVRPEDVEETMRRRGMLPARPSAQDQSHIRAQVEAQTRTQQEQLQTIEYAQPPGAAYRYAGSVAPYTPLHIDSHYAHAPDRSSLEAMIPIAMAPSIASLAMMGGSVMVHSPPLQSHMPLVPTPAFSLATVQPQTTTATTTLPRTFFELLDESHLRRHAGDIQHEHAQPFHHEHEHEHEEEETNTGRETHL